MYNLQRFIDAQERIYPVALEEIKSGMKTSHWMWFIFPQIKGLGFSKTAQYYGIEDLQEAKEYYQHPILGTRLIEITSELLKLDANDPEFVMGYPDNLKLKSSMTLFYAASGDELFIQVLDKYYNGERDDLTLNTLIVL